MIADEDIELCILVMVSMFAIEAMPRPSAHTWCATVPSSRSSAVGSWRVPVITKNCFNSHEKNYEHLSIYLF